MTVEDLLSRISARELSEWEAFFRLEAEEAEKDSGKVTLHTEEAIMSAFQRFADGNRRQP